MKQLVCEMCGGTDLVKDGGVFVCQSCGCKYSIEEAKKMMVEGTVKIDNSAQLGNLIDLAKSSIESHNYEKAEDFCNQILVMDDQNYEAWRLKAEAVNGQIASNKPRIEEVFNCIMTAYDVSSEEEKKEHSSELISWLLVTFQSEISFWLQQVETQRPTKLTVMKARNSFVDSWNKMKTATGKMGIDEKLGEVFLHNLDNYFCSEVNALCVSAWKTTVGYNYYRDYMGKGLEPFGRNEGEQKWLKVNPNTDLYRPTKHIWDTFIEETDLLIELLLFAETHFNETTDEEIKEKIYSNIANLESCVIYSGSWKITKGYTSNWDTYKTVGWAEEYSLTDSAKEIRKNIQKKYERLEEQAKKDGERKKNEKKEKKIAEYWEEYKEEKEKLEKEKSDLEKQVSDIEKKKENIPEKEEWENQNTEIKKVEEDISNLGMFKSKGKKPLKEKLKQLEEKRSQIADIKNKKIKELDDKIWLIKKSIQKIENELTKER